jgi:adenylosuccinate synthase
MSSLVIAGAQWGDEGKGKVVDVLTKQAEVVARYQGGHNAGHTVVIEGKQYILHLVPSGILHKGTLSIIGNGTVVEPSALIKELDGLIEQGIDITPENFLLSKGAHLIMPYHIALDAANEKKRGKAKIGTTGRGIGPAYVDKAMRIGIKVGDLQYPDIFRAKLMGTLQHCNEILDKIYDIKSFFEVQDVYDQYMGYAERLMPYIGDASVAVNQAIDEGKNVLFEGAQGTLLDIDHGTYPYVTSSSSIAGGVCTGLGVGPTKVGKALGIVKAYTTRVGSGPFPTELKDKIGERLQKNGGEFGATTGRPRRCGWLDAVALKHAMRINGMSAIVLTKLDVLSGFDELKICTAYEFRGEQITEFPTTAVELEECKPVYGITMPGWIESTRGATKIEALPAGARDYISAVEDAINTPVEIVSTGPGREELIILKEQF